MSLPGWYPDPGGSPGQYRHWDGRAWSSTTTADPSSAPPGSDGPGPTSPTGTPPRRRRGGAWVAVLAAVLVVLLVTGGLVLSQRRSTVVDDPLPTSTVSGGDDSSPTPTPTPTPTTEAPSASPSPTPGRSATLRTEPCPVGDPLARQDHPQDGRVHGGGLSFPQPEGWDSPGPQVSGFSWAYDVGEADRKVEDHWYAGYAVGAESVADGFEDARSAAELTMECSATSYFYRDVTSRTDLVDEATTVDGHPAWTIRSEIRVDDDRTTFEGDVVQVTVVDLDSPEAVAFFWGCAPIGDDSLVRELDQLAFVLTVD